MPSGRSRGSTKKKSKTSLAAKVRSMTGFGRAESSGPEARLVAEVRAVNGRYLKVSSKVPPKLGSLDARIRKFLSEKGVQRGTVDVYLHFGEGESGGGGEISGEVVKAYAKQMSRLARAEGMPAEVSWEALLSLPGSVKRRDLGGNLEGIWERAVKVLEVAYRSFDGMRQKEGLAMAADVRSRLAALRKHHAALLKLAPQAKKQMLDKFKDRVKKLVSPAQAKELMRPESLEREVVLFSDRMDVSEELARLKSHFQQMEEALSGGGEVGKKLDFLTQELFREVNTVGSKAQNEGITHRVVEMKSLIEKIREQVQNLV